jgi:hypothetical protein
MVWTRRLCLPLLATMACAPAHGQTLIANPGLVIASADVRNIYVGEKQFSGTIRLVPVDNLRAQDKFLANVLRVDADKYNLIWAKKSFREGVNPPPIKASDSEVVDFVHRTPGAVGYIGDATKAIGVNIVK